MLPIPNRGCFKPPAPLQLAPGPIPIPNRHLTALVKQRHNIALRIIQEPIHAAVVVHHHGLAVCAVVEVDVDIVLGVRYMDD